jgi:hypothetical protein
MSSQHPALKRCANYVLYLYQQLFSAAWMSSGPFVSIVLSLLPVQARSQPSAIPLPDSKTTDMYLFKSWDLEQTGPIQAEYVYLQTGIDNVYQGSPSWGTTDGKKFRMIGDYAGEIRDTVPK